MASILLYRSVKTMACRLSMAENPWSGLLIAYLILLSLGRPCSAADVEAVKLRQTVTLGIEEPLSWTLKDLPESLHADATLGLLKHSALSGQVVHQAKEGVRGLFETRAVRTPKGDLLLMFPEGNHYAAGSGKVNDMLAYRSKDDGITWQGPGLPLTSPTASMVSSR